MENEENQNQVSLRFPPPLEIAPRFPQSHNPDDDSPLPKTQNQKARKEPQRLKKPQPPSSGSSFDEKMLLAGQRGNGATGQRSFKLQGGACVLAYALLRSKRPWPPEGVTGNSYCSMAHSKLTFGKHSRVDAGLQLKTSMSVQPPCGGKLTYLIMRRLYV